ncbi:DUF937 domain-containing protein [Paludisphaera borealis]|uniref:DUF937 domain-containing protein n=1 Tax=Paludisphaera borealis TaxID=1387353 RepID=A0A1U7CNV9_9BACT|nr:DUF937 domain-containing protein [Paludisphaera borealis]APW60624.1 hypothetical protein BSF38_02107 [Paludisphaera borealis]
MNIVNLIKDQLTGDVLGKLGASIGESEEKTRAAAAVAVPSLLSVLAGLVSSGQGADKLISALRNFDADSLTRLRTEVTQGDHGKIRDQGGDILGSLVGGNLPALINVLTKFSGVGAVALKGLLSYLAPLILSVIAAQLKGKALTPASLSGFFADQKANISGALPPGFSLAAVPASAPHAEAPGIPNWLLPLAGLVLLGIGAWYFLGNQAAEAPPVGEPEAKKAAPVPTPIEPKIPAPADVEVAIPTADEVTKSLGNVYTSATQALASVKDAATAEAAAPTLTGLDAKIDAAKAVWEKLPDAAKDAVKKATAENLGTFKTLVDKTLELPGVGEKLKAILDALIAKLTAFSA